MRVTHTNANWKNMIFSSLRMPYNWNYNCGVTAPNSTDPSVNNVTRHKYCKRDLQLANDTLLDHTAYYAMNSQPQPFWTFSFARPNPNVSTTAIRNGYVGLLNKLISNSGYQPFDIELGYAVNKYA